MPNSRVAGILTATSLSLFVILGAMVAGNAQILVTVHSLIEHAVRVLS